MDKLAIATQVLLKLIETSKTGFDAERIAGYAWEITNAMQAEAEELINKERPGVLCEVDWSQAPRGAAAYMKLSAWDIGVWIDDLGFQINDAPTFGFTGSHIVERPHGF